MSFHENTEELVKGVCMLEYSHATENWGEIFNNFHEGWAVLKEEVEEAFDSVTVLDTALTDMWYNVRSGDKDLVLRFASSMQEAAIVTMKELAQIWAVCEKIKKGGEE